MEILQTVIGLILKVRTFEGHRVNNDADKRQVAFQVAMGPF